MTLQSPTATLIPLFSSSELTGCGYPGLLDRKNCSDMCPRWESNPRLPACKASTLSTRPGPPLSIGLRGRLPNFISNFLSDRSFNVWIGSTLSDTFEQEQGVPQGSILSPTLFNIKINNIVKCVNDTDSSLYVDDFGIFYKLKNMENIEFRLQRCLNKVETWASENGFKFSKTKT